jgi:hypothetical protein
MSIRKDKMVAIHQPNFFPWLGYFNKIARADVFVFLDDVQFPKTGGVWSNRVKLLVGGEARWVTAAIDRNYSGTRKISEMHFLSTNPWREKLLKTLEANYKKHPFFDETMEVTQPLVLNQESNISEYNIHAIEKIVSEIGMKPGEFVRSSDFAFESTSNELLCDLTTSVGGETYLCGSGADGYQDSHVFDAFKVNLKYQDFQHPTYEQVKSQKFLAGLSVIDAAMNVGWGGVRNLLGAI